MSFIGNIPLFIVGWNFLGGRRFATRTLFSMVFFSLFTDLLLVFLPARGVTDDLVLDTLYGGLLLGLGLGLVYRGQGTSGGSDILARVLNRNLRIPISTSYLLVDGLVVLGSGLAFGWDRALYGLGVIYLSGITAEAISERSGAFRTGLGREISPFSKSSLTSAASSDSYSSSASAKSSISRRLSVRSWRARA